MSCSNVHLRLVKKLPGQPPSGAMVPWSANASPGACGGGGGAPVAGGGGEGSGGPAVSAKFIKQAAPGIAASRHRPAISTGGGAGGGGAGGGGGGAGGSGLLPKRSPAHAVSVASMSSAAAFAAHARRILKCLGVLMRRSPGPCGSRSKIN